MFPFQYNFSLGALDSVNEKHISANRNAVGIVKYLISLQNHKLCCCIRVTANLQLHRSCTPDDYINFVSVSAWDTLSFLTYATTIHIVGSWDLKRDLRCMSE